jgi:tetratricopeptide (TPR) repeat protein
MAKKLCVLLIYLALALSTLMVFWQVRHHEFITFDDQRYIVENDQVKAGLTLEGLIWAWTKAHAYNWHPLTWMSHMLDCEFYGLEPGGHHFTNLLFHVTNALLLLFVLNRITGNLWSSVFVAATFALHPLHVESVAWASERKDVLSTLFWILTMAAYLRYVERPEIKRYLLMILLFAIGLTAKQMLVTLPFVLLLLDYWPLGRLILKKHNPTTPGPVIAPVSVRRCILEKLPLFVLSLIAGLVVYCIQESAEMVKAATYYPFTWRVGNALVTYVAYIKNMFWPAHLAIFYPHPCGGLPAWKIAAAALSIVFITTAVFRNLSRQPYLAVGWLWYLVTLLPVIGLVQVGLQSMADRYTYIPLTGLFMIVAWGVPDLVARLRYRKVILSLFATGLLSASAVTTWHQVRHWQNSITLYTHAADVVQDNWWAANNLGVVLSRKNRLNEAVVYFTDALHIQPRYFEAHINLGAILMRQGKYNQAIAHYYEAMRIRPDLATAHEHLAHTLRGQGKFDEAIKCYIEALRIEPDSASIHNNLGYTLVLQGDLEEAVKHFTEALRLKPDWVDPMNNLALILALYKEAEFHNPAEAIRLAERVCEFTDYEQPDAMYTLAVAYAAGGRFSDAVTTAEKALALAQSLQQAELIEGIQNRLLLYKAGKPYVEPLPVLN